MLTAFRNFLFSCAVSFDLPILDWIQANLQSGFMDTFMPFITKFGDHGTFWMIVAALLFIFPRTRKTGLGMAIAMCGYGKCVTVASPGKIMSEQEMLAALKGGKKCFGMVVEAIPAAVSVLVKAMIG